MRFFPLSPMPILVRPAFPRAIESGILGTT